MTTQKTIRVHITEHHISVIAGYKLWMGKESDLKLIGTSDHPRKTIRDYSDLNPDVFILDYSYNEEETVMPYISELRQSFPDAGLMCATGYVFPHIFRSLQVAGIDGIITKEDGADGFIQCIRSIAAGGCYYSKIVRKYLLQEDKIFELLSSLTPSEKKVLRQMSTGLPDAEIKKILGIATSTLDNHKTNLFAKIRDHGFEVHSKAELAAWFRAFANDISI